MIVHNNNFIHNLKTKNFSDNTWKNLESNYLLMLIYLYFSITFRQCDDDSSYDSCRYKVEKIRLKYFFQENTYI